MIAPQDLHIHTVFSTGDSAVMPEQTVEFIAELKHAKSIGISDHFEYLHGDVYEKYVKKERVGNFNSGAGMGLITLLGLLLLRYSQDSNSY